MSVRISFRFGAVKCNSVAFGSLTQEIVVSIPLFTSSPQPGYHLSPVLGAVPDEAFCGAVSYNAYQNKALIIQLMAIVIPE